MNHPFDDKNLTFNDFRNIIDMGLQGNLDREENITEKTDGQNLMVTWKNGKLRAARNKGQLKNFGKNSLDAVSVARKFKGRGDIRNAFVYAMTDLGKSIKSLSDKQKEKIFNEGEKFMNLEIIYPASSNVINYDVAVLQFHGTLKYNKDGTPVGHSKEDARTLEGMIRQVNQHVQKHFKIVKPQFLTVPAHQDYSKKRDYFFGRLKKLQDTYMLTGSQTLSEYHQAFWEEFVYNAAKQFDYTISNKVLMGLVKRWAFFDKSYKINDIKKDIDNEKFLSWVLSFDKNDHAKYVKSNMLPFEKLFFELGSVILKNAKGFLAVSPKSTVQKMKKTLSNILILLLIISMVSSAEITLSINSIEDNGDGNVIFDIYMKNEVPVSAFQFQLETDSTDIMSFRSFCSYEYSFDNRYFTKSLCEFNDEYNWIH
ncbi:MAG: hypothetical protein QF864_01000, partial [SAR202 cluster bacterium]|nr:hypothetical protein [SAR202 cluster bacterium]